MFLWSCVEYVLRSALYFEVEGQRKKRKPKWTCWKEVEEESTKVDMNRKDALC